MVRNFEARTKEVGNEEETETKDIQTRTGRATGRLLATRCQYAIHPNLACFTLIMSGLSLFLVTHAVYANDGDYMTTFAMFVFGAYFGRALCLLTGESESATQD